MWSRGNTESWYTRTNADFRNSGSLCREECLKILQCKHMVLPSTSPKYCTQGKKPEQLTPSSEENNGKRFDLPKHTSVILDKPPAYQQTCSLNSVSLPTNHRHREPFAHGVFVFLLKSSVTSSLLWKPKLLSFPCCPRWRVAPIPLLGAGGEAARGNCCPTLCAWCAPL